MEQQNTNSPELAKADASVNAELEKKLELYFELRKTAGQYERLKKELNQLFDGVKSLRIGRFLVEGSLQVREERVNKSYSFWGWKAKEVLDVSILAASQGETEL